MTISPGKGVGGVVAGRQPEVGDPPPARLSRHLLGSIFVFLLGPGAVTRVGGPGTPPFWRTRNEFCTVWNSAR